MKPPRSNAYRDHWSGELRKDDVGSEVRVAGWVHRRRDHGGLDLHRPARPDRPAPGGLPPRGGRGGAQAGGGAAIGGRHLGLGRPGRPRGRGGQSRPADRRGRAGRARDRAACGRGDSAVRDRGGRQGGERGAAAPLPIPRPSARAHAAELRAPSRRDHEHPRVPKRPGLPRGRDAGDDALNARGRARLPSSQPLPARLVVRAAAVAAALQADPDDRRLRALLPDRPLLPRRGFARGPAARVHAAGHGDVVRRGGRRDRRWWTA